MAVVGPVGCGKTTLARAIGRMVEVPQGQLYLDGTDITALDLEQLRQQVALVPQEGYLFTATLADNLRYGEPDADQSRVEQAAEQARLAADVRGFPDRYETLVGARDYPEWRPTPTHGPGPSPPRSTPSRAGRRLGQRRQQHRSRDPELDSRPTGPHGLDDQPPALCGGGLRPDFRFRRGREQGHHNLLEQPGTQAPLGEGTGRRAAQPSGLTQSIVLATSPDNQAGARLAEE